MKSTLTLILFVLLLISVSCSSTKKSSKSTEQKDIACNEMILLKTSPDSLRNDPYQLDSLTISDGCLTAYVTYGGGCGDVDFKLYYTEVVTLSLPPQTALTLACEDDDPCRALVSEKITFDLEPFEKEAKSGGIFLLVEPRRILYSE
jgi:hypothetical protein